MNNNISIDELNFVTKEDTFRFGCTCCGACCIERNDILLNAYDVTRLIDYLDIPPNEFLNKYCICYAGDTSRLPIVRLAPMGQGEFCPFLSKGKCQVHEAKPSVCALFPLGRVANMKTKEIKYIIQETTCGSNDIEHSVGDWIENFGLEKEEYIYSLWAEMLNKISTITMDNLIIENPEIYSHVLYFMYIGYNLENFISQLKERLSTIEPFIQMLRIEGKKGSNKTGDHKD